MQSVLDEIRISGGAAPSPESLRASMLARLANVEAQGLLPVINGTGVLLHTNFGRAPLARTALDAVTRLGSGYSNLEFDLETGHRGSRYDRLATQLREISGAQASLVVNNCAAAVLLVLDTFAQGREVVVSRGQLIEIGGGFRLPDVVRKSGATLVEVGTTNKTYPSDYRNSWTPATAMFMRTHPSNYVVEGFVADVDSRTLAQLARELQVISFEDLGSGAVVDIARFGLPREPTLAEEIAAGLDLVAVSGDKLLGGPQCGIVAGRAELIDRMRRNPLLRALRVGKMTIAALSSTLTAYLEHDRLGEIPLFAMLSENYDNLFRRAEALVAQVRVQSSAVSIVPVRTTSTTGGGTLPLGELASAGLCIRANGVGAAHIAQRLRQTRPPVIGRIEDDAVVVDLRTVRREEDPALVRALSTL